MPVVTENGKELGHVIDAEVDDVRFDIIRIAVQPRGVTGFFVSPLLIHRDQIVRVTEKSIVVADGTYKDTTKQPASA